MFTFKSQAARIAFALSALTLSLTTAAVAGNPPCPVPEPSTIGLIGLGLASIVLIARRRRS